MRLFCYTEDRVKIIYKDCFIFFSSQRRFCSACRTDGYRDKTSNASRITWNSFCRVLRSNLRRREINKTPNRNSYLRSFLLNRLLRGLSLTFRIPAQETRSSVGFATFPFKSCDQLWITSLLTGTASLPMR